MLKWKSKKKRSQNVNEWTESKGFTPIKNTIFENKKYFWKLLCSLKIHPLSQSVDFYTKCHMNTAYAHLQTLENDVEKIIRKFQVIKIFSN